MQAHSRGAERDLTPEVELGMVFVTVAGVAVLSNLATAPPAESPELQLEAEALNEEKKVGRALARPLLTATTRVVEMVRQMIQQLRVLLARRTNPDRRAGMLGPLSSLLCKLC